MKTLLILLTFALSSNVFATPVNLACVTEYPTTSFVAFTEENSVIFKFIHHNGVKYMPIWSSVITPNDLSTLNDVASVLTELGDMLVFNMPEKNCSPMEGMLLNCFGAQPAIEINGHQVSLWAVYSKEMVETSFAGSFSYIGTNLAIDVDGKSYHIPMKYSDYECFKDLNSQGLNKKLKLKNVFLK
ncbi:MAG: hypothetical protein K2Q18_14240 [Bdellovibrionales bacterium]|nr:hypothetical protein [Bdellovibrionales bacterium]